MECIKQVGMSQRATLATQNGMTTCLETFEEERFCSFSHRHGDATGKPATRDETCGSIKTIISCEAFPIFTLCSFKIDVFLRVFLGTFLNLLPQKAMFRARLPSIFNHLAKCHACLGICTLPPLDAALPMRFAKTTQNDMSKVVRLPGKMTMDTSKVLRLPRKLQRILQKRRKSIAPATQNHFRHVTKHV